MKSTDIGYINKNNQKNHGRKCKSDNHYNQWFYEMECLECGHRYYANGSDVWLRKCPSCQKTKQTVNSILINKYAISSTRKISDKMRYQVLKRDNFKCCTCGASPAKDPAVELHIDHVIPWSKGGKTEFDNLQTLCSKCNLGKSDSM